MNHTNVKLEHVGAVDAYIAAVENLIEAKTKRDPDQIRQAQESVDSLKGRINEATIHDKRRLKRRSPHCGRNRSRSRRYW